MPPVDLASPRTGVLGPMSRFCRRSWTTRGQESRQVAAPNVRYGPEYCHGGGAYAPPGGRVHTVVIGGMPGWQIALIALGAAPARCYGRGSGVPGMDRRRKPVTATA
jgi:hypothetical protein